MLLEDGTQSPIRTHTTRAREGTSRRPRAEKQKHVRMFPTLVPRAVGGGWVGGEGLGSFLLSYFPTRITSWGNDASRECALTPNVRQSGARRKGQPPHNLLPRSALYRHIRHLLGLHDRETWRSVSGQVTTFPGDEVATKNATLKIIMGATLLVVTGDGAYLIGGDEVHFQPHLWLLIVRLLGRSSRSW